MNEREPSEPTHDPNDPNGPTNGPNGPDLPWPPGTGWWFLASLVIGALILCVKLWPFAFARDGGGFLGLHDGGALVVLGQVALFVPFGFIQTQLARRVLPTSIALIVVIVTFDGLLLGLFGETAQYWMPDRISSVIDLAANTLGTVIGYKLAALFMRG